MYCPNCGINLPDQAVFCSECGNAIHPLKPHRNVFVMIAIVVLAIILLSTIIIFSLQGKNEKNDRQDAKETYIEKNQPEKVLEEDIDEEVFTEEAFTEETEEAIEEPKGELTAKDMEGRWRVSLYDDGEYSYKEEWIWIVSPIDETNFIINFPPDELFDEE